MRSRHTTLHVIVVAACSVGTVAAQPASHSAHTEVYQESAPPTPQATARPRVDVAVGFTIVNIRAVPPCVDIGCTSPHRGGGALSYFASAGYFWTPHLITQVEIVSQAEGSGWDYAHQWVVPGRGGGGTGITLKHNYVGGRRTVAQIVQIGGRGWFIRPYVGAGAGIESQTTYDSWYEGGVVGPNLKTVNEFPNELPKKEANFAIVFGEAGVKAFLGRHAYVLLDGKLTNRTDLFVRFGFGVELP